MVAFDASVGIPSCARLVLTSTVCSDDNLSEIAAISAVASRAFALPCRVISPVVSAGDLIGPWLLSVCGRLRSVSLDTSWGGMVSAAAR